MRLDVCEHCRKNSIAIEILIVPTSCTCQPMRETIALHFLGGKLSYFIDGMELGPLPLATGPKPVSVLRPAPNISLGLCLKSDCVLAFACVSVK